MTARGDHAGHGSAQRGYRPVAVLCLLVAPLTLIATTSCSSAKKPTATANHQSVSPAPANQGSGVTAAPSGPAASAATPGGSDAAGTPGQPDAGTRCHSDKLKVEAEPGDSAAGRFTVTLVFTNTGGEPCVMRGYPGVSFVKGDAGDQVNDPAQRGEGFPVTTVTLAPGAVAHADLRMVRSGNYDESACKPVGINGLRIYPPDETAAVFAKSDQEVCSAGGVGIAQIYPVQSGRSG